MLKLLKILVSLLLAFGVLALLFVNASLYHTPEFRAISGMQMNTDVLGQLRYLKSKMRMGAGAEMQSQYPEGFVFINALYGLSWYEVAVVAPAKSDLRKEALEELQFACDAILSDDGKRVFTADMDLPYGAFYNGWSSYLLGKKLSITAVEKRDSGEVRIFNDQCRRISANLSGGTSPFPESYPNGAWPADGMVCAASLALWDRTFIPAYKETIERWLQRVKTNTDPLGLVPHQVSSKTGKPLEFSRGSSQSLTLVLLLEVDSAFAKEQFALYKDWFLDYTFGLPGIREYRMGKTAAADIDSGPVILGIGGASTIVGMRTMALFGEQTIATGLRNTIEATAFPMYSNGEKKYLFGALPMADVFIAWANSVEMTEQKKLQPDPHWRLRFQLYSLCVILLCLVAVFLIRPSKKSSSG
ncbi:MAG TPA: hypothetical protein VD816_00605 [Ohtaekwangia sp.]|nr:hypothetical protein [Ohtaekwangia sp.]